MEINKNILCTKNFTTVAVCGSFTSNTFHRHMHWEFVVCKENDATHYINETIHTLPKYTIMAISDKVTHRIFTKNLNHLHRDIYLSDEIVKELCTTFFSNSLYEKLCNYKESYITLSWGDFKTIENSLIEIGELFEYRPTQKNMLRALIIYILSLFYKKDLQKDEAPQALKDFIQKIQSPAVFCLPLSEIYPLSFFSKSRLSFLFKQYYKCTLFEYTNNLKLQYAKNLLLNSDKTILEISSILNYDSLSYFIKFFKDKTGVTPLKYRHENNSNQS